jgi:hypothetical protein
MAPRAKKGRVREFAPPLLDDLERAFDARAIIYATGTRNPPNLFSGQIASDVLPIIGRHLDVIGKVKNLALVLHTKGGALDAPWPLVNMLRHHCKELYVCVPEFALSAGTLIALGAEKIFMLPHAFLSPVDPTGSYNIEGKQQSYSVEDVMGYVDFVTERVGIRDQEALVQSLTQLTQEVKATILGSIHRTRSLIERLGTNLLQLHIKKIDDQKRVAKIVDMLTHSLFTHQHMIPRREARNVIGLDEVADDLTAPQDQALRAAREHIRSELQCMEPFDPEALLADAEARAPKKKDGDPNENETRKLYLTIDSKRAIVESRAGQDAFVTRCKISRGPGEQIQVKAIGVPAWGLVS